MAEEYGLAVAIWNEGDEDEIRLGIAEYTKGGMAFRYSETHWGPTYDQGGDTPVDQVKTGESAEADVFIAEMVVDKFGEIFPSASVVENAGKKKIEWGGKVGEGMLKYAKPLTLRPLSCIGSLEEGEDDKSQDVTLLHAVPRAEFDLAFQLQQEKVYKVTFIGVRDKATGKMWVYGDRSIEAPSD